MGYHHAGFEVVGVDIKSQPRYPFEFHKADAIAILQTAIRGPAALLDFQIHIDAIHASPPCQRYSDLAKRNGNAAAWPDLVPPVRQLLEKTGLPWVIENVQGAPLRDPEWLCGTMFPGLRVLRHRGFESNVYMASPMGCWEHPVHPLVYTRDKRKAHYGKLNEMTAFVSVNGGGNCSVRAARDAMGIDWMTKVELNEAIPPAYTGWIGSFLLNAVREKAA